MAARFGICNNFGECTAARNQQRVKLTASEPFNCSQCKQQLTVVHPKAWRHILIFGTPIGLVLGLVLILSVSTSDPPTPPQPPTPAVAPPPPLPPPPAPEAARARTLVTEGLAMMAKRHVDEARKTFAEATRLDPTNVHAWVNLGASEMTLGRPEPALAAYHRALNLDGGNWQAHYNLGAYFARRGDSEAALAHLRHSLATLHQQNNQVPLAGVRADLRNSSDFRDLRHDARFQSLLAEAGP